MKRAWADILQSRWRIAVWVIAILAAIVTPAPDAATMLGTFMLLFGIYGLAIVLIRLSTSAVVPSEDKPNPSDDVSV